MKFTLNITLGNDAMLTGEDLSNALQDVSNKLLDNEYIRYLGKEGSGNIVCRINDRNGNKVGSFVLSHNEE